MGIQGLCRLGLGAVHSTVVTVNSGLSLDIPSPGPFFGAPLLAPAKRGDVSGSVIDDHVRRILRVLFFVGAFDNEQANLPKALDVPEHRALAYELASEAIVLLKNGGDALPFRRGKVKSIAVIGPNAGVARPGGGGQFHRGAVLQRQPSPKPSEKSGDSIQIKYAKSCMIPS